MRTCEWNQEHYDGDSYICPEGEKYCLKLFEPHDEELLFEYKCPDTNKKIKGRVSTKIKYDHHCFTKERGEFDESSVSPTLVVDIYKDGSRKERVFCNKRYEFAKNLRFTMKNLSYKMCRESKILGKAIRLEQANQQNPLHGIYIVIKTRPRSNKMELFVETAHFRTNEPNEANLRKQPSRFMLILGGWIKSGKKGYSSLRP